MVTGKETIPSRCSPCQPWVIYLGEEWLDSDLCPLLGWGRPALMWLHSYLPEANSLLTKNFLAMHGMRLVPPTFKTVLFARTSDILTSPVHRHI